ncbi:hypothetical protein RTBOTA2_000781 [Rhodotorula toruloides]|nr:hypothetical protein RTBOTA2_000781 [Rhodotorula toruloides]
MVATTPFKRAFQNVKPAQIRLTILFLPFHRSKRPEQLIKIADQPVESSLEVIRRSFRLIKPLKHRIQRLLVHLLAFRTSLRRPVLESGYHGT